MVAMVNNTRPYNTTNMLAYWEIYPKSLTVVGRRNRSSVLYQSFLYFYIISYAYNVSVQFKRSQKH